MKWSEDSEEALQVVFKMLVRQLGLPEKSLLVTDWATWSNLHPEDKHDWHKLRGLSSPQDFHVFTNVDDSNNFYDNVVTIAHELFHLRRPKIVDEYRIHNYADKWINHAIYPQVDMLIL